MKKRELIVLGVASKIIISCCDSGVSPVPFDAAQTIAEDVLKYLEEIGTLKLELEDEE
jgi:hypothetical protein